MKKKYERIKSLGTVYRQARLRAEKLCRREFLPFYDRKEIQNTVRYILNLKDVSVFAEDAPGVYLDGVIKRLCLAAPGDTIFLYADENGDNNFYTAAYLANSNVFLHGCKELKKFGDICIPGEYVINTENKNQKSEEYYKDIADYLKQKRIKYLADYLKKMP